MCDMAYSIYDTFYVGNCMRDMLYKRKGKKRSIMSDFHSVLRVYILGQHLYIHIRINSFLYICSHTYHNKRAIYKLCITSTNKIKCVRFYTV